MNQRVIDDLTKKISSARSDMARYSRLHRQLKVIREEQQTLEEKVTGLFEQLKKEEHDVKKLEGKSLSGMLFELFGNKENKLKKEKQEFLAAKLKHEEAELQLVALCQRYKKMQHELESLSSSESQYHKLLQEKEQMLMQRGGETARCLIDLDREIDHVEILVKETQEAIQAGEYAYQSLSRVFEMLNSAHGWGVFDMLGGGLITTAIKHSKIDAARSEMTQAQIALSNFQRELSDIKERVEDDKIQIGNFATFADYFLDGIIFDFVVQSKINKSREDVKVTLDSVTNSLAQLKNQLEKLIRRLEQLKSDRTGLLEK